MGAVPAHDTKCPLLHSKRLSREPGSGQLLTQSGLRRVCDAVTTAGDAVTTTGAVAKLLRWFRSNVELLQKFGLWRYRRARGFRISTLSPATRKLVVVHTGVITVPPIGATGNHGLAPQPRTSSIPVAAIVTRPPSHAYSDEAVIEAMVVMDEVIVIVVVAVPVLAMPIVAMPCRAAMPSTTAPSANTGDVSATYSASADMAAADVADVTSAYVDAAHVTAAHVPTAEMRSAAHVTASHMASGIRLTHQGRDKQQTASKGSDCGYMLFHDSSPWVCKGVVPPADFVASLTLKRGGSLRGIASLQSKDGVQPLVGSNSTSLSCRLFVTPA